MRGVAIKLSLLFVVGLFSLQGFSQDDPYEIEKHPFIKYELNNLLVYDTLTYNLLFDKLTQIGFKGAGKVSIVHIGDSHLQADFLSGNFRRKLQTFFLGAMGGRGFIFPYKVAQTNNPLNYKVASKGIWENCRNVEKNKNCTLGLSGISVSTTDKNASISIGIDDPKLKGYDFDKLMVFHEFSATDFHPIIESKQLKAVKPFPEKGYTLFEFNESIAKVKFKLDKTDSLQNHFSLFGFNFASSDPGIIYHTIGVNGAQFESYLSCKYFVPNLRALNPDWVIVSLGTNDAYTLDFDTVNFKKSVECLVGYIKDAAPNAAVLLTTPGDHRIRKIDINTNVQLASNILMRIAKRKELSCWDFNTVMGGLGAIDYWNRAGLAHTDYLHYSRKGYEYQAQLLFSAFLKAYDDYLSQQILNKN